MGVHSVDRFCDQVEEVVNRFADLTDTLNGSQKRLDDLTGFWRYSGTKVKQSVLGMLLQMFAVANGDVSKVKWDIKDDAPFIKFKLHGLSSKDLEEYIEAFEKFMIDVMDAITEKIPRIL